MRPGAKYAVIYRHRNEYPISVMCCFFQVSRSGYYDFVHRLGRPEKDAALAEIIAEQRERSFRTYGYRRMWLVLEKQGIHRNPKTILRIMEKYNLLAEIRRRRKRVNMGQQVHKYENLLNRRFHADRPNSKWVTDISYIHTKQGVLYLSMIRDLYDNSIVAYKTGTQQTVNLVLDTIRLAMKREKKRVKIQRIGIAWRRGMRQTAFLLFIRNSTIQISDDRIRTILKFYIILIRPPHIQITIFIILCAGRIKGMGNLMTYGRVDCQFFFIVHVFTVHRRHQ